jgi:ribosomal protein S18 acetylase RimI-like enzyme
MRHYLQSLAPGLFANLPQAHVRKTYEWTGHKLGDVLMAQCLEHVRHSGFETIWLTVWRNNERAIRFYKRWGFRKLGVYDFVVGRDIQEDFLLLRNIHSA